MTIGHADAARVIRSLFPTGADDAWLEEMLLHLEPEPLGSIAGRERTARERGWTVKPGPIAATLPMPPEAGRSSALPVIAHFFPGRTGRRALVIGGVHGDEPQGARVVEALRADLRAAVSRIAGLRPECDRLAI